LHSRCGLHAIFGRGRSAIGLCCHRRRCSWFAATGPDRRPGNKQTQTPSPHPGRYSPSRAQSCKWSKPAGQTASNNLQLMPGFTGTLTFQRAGVPPAATCSVPASMMVTSGTPYPLTIAISTTGTGAQMRPDQSQRVPPIPSSAKSIRSEKKRARLAPHPLIFQR